MLFDQRLIANAVPFSASVDGFILLQFVLRGSQVPLLRRDARERLRFGGFRGVELAECARGHVRNRCLRRMRLRSPGRKVGFWMFAPSRVVPWRELLHNGPPLQ